MNLNENRSRMDGDDLDDMVRFLSCSLSFFQDLVNHDKYEDTQFPRPCICSVVQ